MAKKLAKQVIQSNNFFVYYAGSRNNAQNSSLYINEAEEAIEQDIRR